MTKQETFNTVARHLLSMDEQSLTPRGACAYRGENGRKCAVGVLIPDEFYAPSMEGLGAGDSRVAGVLQSFGHDVNLCMQLQSIHDNQWLIRRSALERLAMVHCLEMPSEKETA